MATPRSPADDSQSTPPPRRRGPRGRRPLRTVCSGGASHRRALRVLGLAPRAAGSRRLVRRRGAARTHVPARRGRLRGLRGRWGHLLRRRPPLLPLERTGQLVLRPAPDPPHVGSLVRARRAPRAPLVAHLLPTEPPGRRLGHPRRLLRLVRRLRRLVLVVLVDVAHQPLAPASHLRDDPLPLAPVVHVLRLRPRPSPLERTPSPVHRPPQPRPGATSPARGSVRALGPLGRPLHRRPRQLRRQPRRPPERRRPT